MNPSAIVLPAGKNIYFASDFHLGSPDFDASLAREKKVVRWLNTVKNDAHSIYILGDIFDFWYEYKHAVPKGYTRLLGTIASLCDLGINVIFFTGNHDLWMFDYLKKELGVTIHRKPVSLLVNDNKILVGHGDGLGPGDFKYKLIKKIFENRLMQWFFRCIHPDIGIPFANRLSRSSRKKNRKKDAEFLGDKEWLIQYCREIEKKGHHDLYIFGHRHFPVDMKLGDNSRYINLGDWMDYFTFAVIKNNEIKLEKFEG